MDDTPGTGVVGFPQRPEDRLRLAMRRLDEALAEQREAIATFRSNLGELSKAVSGVKDGLDSYQGSLSDLAVGVDRLGTEARALSETCERAEGARD